MFIVLLHLGPSNGVIIHALNPQSKIRGHFFAQSKVLTNIIQFVRCEPEFVLSNLVQIYLLERTRRTEAVLEELPVDYWNVESGAIVMNDNIRCIQKSP